MGYDNDLIAGWGWEQQYPQLLLLFAPCPAATKVLPKAPCRIVGSAPQQGKVPTVLLEPAQEHGQVLVGWHPGDPSLGGLLQGTGSDTAHQFS